jgi:transcriptional regulator GlxA family with amidase domain
LNDLSRGQELYPNEPLLYARKFIDENFNQKITIEDLAQIVGYSYDHFRHLFKNKFGISPIFYVMSKRLDKARSLLRSSELSVTAISMECGFSNDPQFCNIFKMEFGESPLSYRRNSFPSQSSKLE